MSALFVPVKKMHKRERTDEGYGVGYYFKSLDKSSVLQEAKLFNETPIKPLKCCHILTKILYILNQGEQVGTIEATETFFSITKLFQCKDVSLRKMVYLCIKELSNISQDVIIVTSSLTKDMTSKEDQFRGPAIRALCCITDSTMIQAIERYMKQAIVDKVYSVSSAALVSSMHLSRSSPDIVKRWVNEAQEAVSSDNIMVQYHALGLLYHIRRYDKLAVSKLVSKFTRQPLKSPYAYCLLINIAMKLLNQEDAGIHNPIFEFIESCLRHKSEMVVYEAASAIVNMKNTTAKQLTPAVSVLQIFCSSPKPTLRFAAVKTLSKIATKHPSVVIACNLDLENLITDANRSIATLAITTLLKTGSEGSVDRLMKQISSFMSEISDEFKIVVVHSIRSLCIKFPRKSSVLMNFLSSMLREEGGFDYKYAIVDTIIRIIEEHVEAREIGLSYLCEFIEDCEHTILSTRILHLLGCEGPRTHNPSQYIRFIYNRVILENSTIRAAAVTALAKFGAHSDHLLPSILVLLQRSMVDTDDEVRDRATFYYHVLKENQKAFNSYVMNNLQVSIVGLERALYLYSLSPSEEPFDIKSVPIATRPLSEQKASNVTTDEGFTTKPKDNITSSSQEIYAEQLTALQKVVPLGPLFKSSSMPQELTESETEYVVRCVKHTFSKFIVFQFDCTNTLNDQVLENVTVQMENSEGFEVIKYVPAESLQYDKVGITYTIVKLPEDPEQTTGTFTCTMKFLVRDCDPTTGEPDEDGYEDEYMLEDMEIVTADHVMRVIKPNFAAAWEEIGEENEIEETFSLSTMKSIEEAVTNITDFLGMQPCERSDKVTEGKSSHTLYLAGVYRGGYEVLVRAKLAVKNGVAMQLTVRSSNSYVAEIIGSAVG